MSIGVRWTSVRLSAAVQSFLVEFHCLLGDIPVVSLSESPSDSTSLASMHRKVTGKSPDNSSRSRAKNLAFWIGRVRWSPPGVCLEKGGSVKTSDLDAFSSWSCRVLDEGVRINACRPGCFDVCYRGLVLWARLCLTAFLRARLSVVE